MFTHDTCCRTHLWSGRLFFLLNLTGQYWNLFLNTFSIQIAILTCATHIYDTHSKTLHTHVEQSEKGKEDKKEQCSTPTRIAAERKEREREREKKTPIKAAATIISSPFLDKAPDDAESIVERSVGLLQHKLVGATDQHSHCLTRVGDTCGLCNTSHCQQNCLLAFL